MNELNHHGVKGMRWGKRKGKSKNKPSTKTSKGKNTTKRILKGLGVTAVSAAAAGGLVIAGSYAASKALQVGLGKFTIAAIDGFKG